MKGKKTYLQPIEMVLNAIHDIGALQKGQVIFCDTPRGLIGYRIMMYGEELDYNFKVTDIGNGCSRVTIELAAGTADDERLIDNEFALLDYALLNKAKIDFAEREEWDKKLFNEKPKTND